MVAELWTWVQANYLIGVCSFVAGGLATSVVQFARARVRTLEYTVEHQRVGVTTHDPIFGAVQVSYSGTTIPNLYWSKVTLLNSTTRDLTNLTVVVYADQHLRIFSSTGRVAGTLQTVEYTESFRERIDVPEGEQPTQLQRNFYASRREYVLPIFNRGQRAEIECVSTLLPQGSSPSIWLEVQEPGVTARYRLVTPSVFGVPVRKAAVYGVVVILIVLAAAIFMAEISPLAAFLLIAVGAFAQWLGAYLYRLIDTVRAFVIR